MAAPGLGGQDEVFIDNVSVQAWRDTGIRVPAVLQELLGGRVWRFIPAPAALPGDGSADGRIVD